MSDLSLFAKNEPTVFECLIAVTQLGTGVLLTSLPDIYENEIFDGHILEENISTTYRKDIPTNPGIYLCKILARTTKCNHPQDPVEYDLTTWITDIAQVGIHPL